MKQTASRPRSPTGRVQATAARAGVALDAGFGLVATRERAARCAACDSARRPPFPCSDRVLRLPVRVTWSAVSEARAIACSSSRPASRRRRSPTCWSTRPKRAGPIVEDGSYRLVVRADRRRRSRGARCERHAHGRRASRAAVCQCAGERAVASMAIAPSSGGRSPKARQATTCRWRPTPRSRRRSSTWRSRADVSDAHALPPGIYFWRVASRTADWRARAIR